MKIFLVEDDIDIINFLKKSLEAEGYEVDYENDGKKALDHIKKNNPDLIILDLILPGMGGEEIMRELRMMKISTPVIILTAISKSEQRVRMLDLGADDYLCKPFSIVELIARIKSVLRRSGKVENDPEIIKAGDIIIYRNMRMVTRGGKEIKLRYREYELLLYMIKNPNSIISRDALIRNVWNYNTDIYSNTVDAHMSSLRKKINKGFDKDAIETVYGVGYIFRIL